MRSTRFFVSIFLAGFIFSGSSFAADVVQPAAESSQLDTISGTSSSDLKQEDECPMHKGQKPCKEKHGKPCPYHEHEHHDKSHEKCEHEHSK